MWVLEPLFKPCVPAEMAVLLGTQAIGQATGGQIDVGVSEHGVLGNISPQLASFDEPFGKISPRPHFVGIYRLAIGHVHSVVVQNLAGLQVTLGDSAHLDDWSCD